MILVLLGYMASGKSTIGQILAKHLDYKFIDLDTYIEDQEQETIGNIFSDKGEIYFRRIESKYLQHIVEEANKNIVLSLGGGTPCYSGNMNLLLKSTNVITFYLKIGLDAIVDRLFLECTARPLISHIKTKDDLKDFVRKHLFERSPIYEQSEYKILVDNSSPDEVIEKILLKLY